MPKLSLNTGEEFSSMRLDKYLATEVNDISRSKIKELILLGNVSIDAQVVKDPSYKLHEKINVEIEYEFNNETSIVPKDIALDIVYEDDDLIVLNKQPGLTVHPGAGNYNDTLVNALVNYCGEHLSSISGEARPGIVHRLDRDTSGLMVVAKNDFTHSKLSEALAERKISRKYIALIYKSLSPLMGRISTGYGKSKRDPKKMVASFAKDKLAITNYKTIEELCEGAFSLVEFTLETGRTHQIRFHLEHMGTRLIGEKTYGKNLNFNFSKVSKEILDSFKRVKRQLLHSYKLEFEHPRTGETHKFETQYPDEIKQIIALTQE